MISIFLPLILKKIIDTQNTILKKPLVLKKTFKIFETAFKSLRHNKASGIHAINSNIVLDIFEEFKTPLFYIFEPH